MKVEINQYKIVKPKMKVEIWSDVMCPFCYLGKRKFEIALEQFAHKDDVEIEWKSFQLQPDLVTDTTININQYLADIKDFPIEQARQMNNQVAQAGKAIGLTYNVEQIVVANSFKAHNLIQFAKTQQKQNEIEEKLFEAYFAEGKNIDDIPTLIEVAEKAGLNTNGLAEALENADFAEQVQADVNDARKLGVRGVPFFAFNRKYAISGAQEPAAFLSTLEKSFADWKNDKSVLKA